MKEIFQEQIPSYSLRTENFWNLEIIEQFIGERNRTTIEVQKQGNLFLSEKDKETETSEMRTVDYVKILFPI